MRNHLLKGLHMRNRVLQVKMVKPEASETLPSDQIDQFEERAALVGCYIEKTVKMVGGAVLAYIAADTVRQVMVVKVSK